MEATPIEIVQKQRLRIIAEIEYQAELDKELKQKQEDQERAWQRQQSRR